MRSSRSPHANDRWSQTAPARHRTAATRRGRGADSPVSPSWRGTRMLHRLLALLAGALALIAAFAAIGLHAAEATPPQPEIFAPGAISGPAGIDCLTFAPDGATVYFDQQAGASGFIMEAHRVGGGWSAPRIAPFSGQWLDHDPAMALDGSYLVFTSNRPDVAGGAPLHGGHLWRVDRRGDGWGAPVRLPDTVNVGTAVYAPGAAAATSHRSGSRWAMRPRNKTPRSHRTVPSSCSTRTTPARTSPIISTSPSATATAGARRSISATRWIATSRGVRTWARTAAPCTSPATAPCRCTTRARPRRRVPTWRGCARGTTATITSGACRWHPG